MLLTLNKKYNILSPRWLSGQEKAPSQTISVLYAFLLLQNISRQYKRLKMRTKIKMRMGPKKAVQSGPVCPDLEAQRLK